MVRTIAAYRSHPGHTFLPITHNSEDTRGLQLFVRSLVVTDGFVTSDYGSALSTAVTLLLRV